MLVLGGGRLHTLQWQWGHIGPQIGPRQVLGPFGRTYEPTRHSGDERGTPVASAVHGAPSLGDVAM